jgi:anti-sigma B factor antagonist
MSLGDEDVSAHHDMQQLSTQPRSGQLRVSIGRSESIPVLKVVGEVDMSSVSLLRERYEQVASESVPRLLVDLSGVTFLDSSGLAVLISMDEELHARGAQLTLLAPTPAVRRLFDITGLTLIFEIDPLES